MSDDDDWEFTALEEDKRTLPGLVIEVGGKSYADAVLQQCSKVEIVKVVAMPHEVIHAEKPTFMKVKPGRKLQFKRQSKSKKDEKIVASILKRESPVTLELTTNHKTMVSLAEDFALSDACQAMILDVTLGQFDRLPYTKQLELLVQQELEDQS
uniref:Acetylglutamate kinase n=1 Tax=Lygus hesperus TaxID=30085 RepID=A0A0A9XBZ2_LYGHE